MVRSAVGKVMWVGRATVFLVGLAVILALVLGLASAALGADGDFFKLGKRNVAQSVSTLVKQGAGPALRLQVGANQPPMEANTAAGTATGLSADELDGLDSSEITPLVRSQKDQAPAVVSTGDADTVQTNRVSITTPAAGFLIIWGTVEVTNTTGTPGPGLNQTFVAKVKLDGNETAAVAAAIKTPTGDIVEHLAPSMTVPVSAGQHTVVIEVTRMPLLTSS